MAITARVRFVPDVLSDKTTVAGGDPQAGTGTAYFPIQVCVYDDAVVTAQNYSPGDPATEKNINVVHSDVIQGDLAALAAMTNAAFQGWCDQQLDAWATANKPLLTSLARLRFLAMRRPPRAIP